jgi:hypothetical protein
MFEIITLVAQAAAPPAPLPVTRAERMLVLSDVADWSDVEPASIDELVQRALVAAIERGELPTSLDRLMATRLVKGLFYGLPLATRAEGIAAIGPTYVAGLEVLRAALSAAS